MSDGVAVQVSEMPCSQTAQETSGCFKAQAATSKGPSRKQYEPITASGTTFKKISVLLYPNDSTADPPSGVGCARGAASRWCDPAAGDPQPAPFPTIANETS